MYVRFYFSFQILDQNHSQAVNGAAEQSGNHSSANQPGTSESQSNGESKQKYNNEIKYLILLYTHVILEWGSAI